MNNIDRITNSTHITVILWLIYVLTKLNFDYFWLITGVTIFNLGLSLILFLRELNG